MNWKDTAGGRWSLHECDARCENGTQGAIIKVTTCHDHDLHTHPRLHYCSRVPRRTGAVPTVRLTAALGPVLLTHGRLFRQHQLVGAEDEDGCLRRRHHEREQSLQNLCLAL